MAETDTTLRSLHDLGLAAWFGGSLMGAVGVNGAAAQVSDPKERPQIANAGWAKWVPVQATAIGAHLVGGAGILYTNKGRALTQPGVRANTVIKLAATGVALGLTAYSRVVAKKIEKAGPVPAQGATEPSSSTPPDVASAQKQLKALQWAIPAVTGVIVVLTSQQGEQQKPNVVAASTAKGLGRFLNPAK